MKAHDILAYFLAQAPWVNRHTTVDKVITKDTETSFDHCLVTWMPSYRALKYALAQNIQLIICHEPVFWNQQDTVPDTLAGREKANFINAHNLTIIRLHDTWDRWPTIGITAAWANFLSLPKTPTLIHEKAYLHRYDIKPITVRDFATSVAAHCAQLGEPQVQLIGDASLWVSKIGIGSGRACAITSLQQMGCDCSVVCDDSGTYWSDIQQARDAGHPVIRVNHGTSEEPGMKTLTHYINNSFDGLTAEHLVHGSMYSSIGEIIWQRNLRA